ncbi:hypothetical protein HPB51_028596 [Rhipicephalus microplus]|uniref:Uncharacterized protein n=1 Tax=Rhipicephalus microplus TaxID=6941 RepID=A0A9J6CWX2_RHIMP|nr:hypothetical protein HPB51_028596 [Rhipicephalus microplus]
MAVYDDYGHDSSLLMELGGHQPVGMSSPTMRYHKRGNAFSDQEPSTLLGLVARDSGSPVVPKGLPHLHRQVPRAQLPPSPIVSAVAAETMGGVERRLTRDAMDRYLRERGDMDRYLRERGDMVLVILHAKVALKSYEN